MSEEQIQNDAAAMALLQRKFHAEMVDVHTKAKNEVGYNATRFIQMVSEIGGVATAERLIDATGVSDGFTTLWEAGRLDISVEAVVLRPEFARLFDAKRLRVARQRLVEYEYVFPQETA